MADFFGDYMISCMFISDENETDFRNVKRNIKKIIEEISNEKIVFYFYENSKFENYCLDFISSLKGYSNISCIYVIYDSARFRYYHKNKKLFNGYLLDLKRNQLTKQFSVLNDLLEICNLAITHIDDQCYYKFINKLTHEKDIITLQI